MLITADKNTLFQNLLNPLLLVAQLNLLRGFKTSLVIFSWALFVACGQNKTETKETASDTAITAKVAVDPLPGWNEGPTKTAIVQFVARVTKAGGADFVAEKDRIATFDNDGTLWSEQPLYFQFLFVLDRFKAMAPQHPEWKTKEPYKTLLKGDVKSVLAGGEKTLVPLLLATHTGMSESQFKSIVKDWIGVATHPTKKKKYTELVFQPMLELLTYLRANGFKTFIVSGGEVSFMRAWAEDAYGIPPYQIIGTEFKLKYDVVRDTAVVERLPAINRIDDGPGKPVGIQMNIGMKPIFAAGNSDGDYEMLRYVTNGTGPRMGIIVHHTDSTREWSYDRKSPIGKLERGLDDAGKYGWVLVDMQKDWNVVYPFDKK